MSGFAEMVLSDDLDVSMDPETYADQSGPSPVPAGNFNVRVVKHGPRKNKEGQAILTDGKYPIIALEQIEIVEPDEFAGRKVMLFQDIRTKPFERFDPVRGMKVLASGLGDITRAFDQREGWSGLRAGLELLDQFLAENATMRVQLNWTAYDKDYVEQTFDEMGGKDALSKDEQNEVYNKARLRGMKKFPKLPNGKFSHIWVGPSGSPCEARVEITRFFPSLEEVRLGAF